MVNCWPFISRGRTQFRAILKHILTGSNRRVCLNASRGCQCGLQSDGPVRTRTRKPFAFGSETPLTVGHSAGQDSIDLSHEHLPLAASRKYHLHSRIRQLQSMHRKARSASSCSLDSVPSRRLCRECEVSSCRVDILGGSCSCSVALCTRTIQLM